MTVSHSVSAGECEQKQSTSLEDKVALLTAEIEALRTQVASVEGSLAALRAGTKRMADMLGMPDVVLRTLEAPSHECKGMAA